MAIRAADLVKAFPELLKHHQGPLEGEALSPSSQIEPKKNSIVYVADAEHLENIFNSEASIVVAHEKLQTKIDAVLASSKTAKNKTEKTILLAKSSYLAMAVINQKFFPVADHKQSFSKENIHPSAQIHPTAELDSTVKVGPNTVIYANTKIGANTFVGANCVIESNVRIGENCFIHHMVNIGHGTQIGRHVELKSNSTIGSDGFGYAQDDKGNHYRLPHYGPLIIEDDVHIGSNVIIDRGTFEPSRIGRGTKVDNHCHFGHNIQIGKNCLVTAGFISAGSAKIGDNCVFAGRASMNGHIELGNGVTLGPLSAATNSILEPGVYMGFPPIPFKQALKVNASLASLPTIRKNLSKVLKQLGMKTED